MHHFHGICFCMHHFMACALCASFVCDLYDLCVYFQSLLGVYLFTLCALRVSFHSMRLLCVIAEHSRDSAASGERGDSHAHRAAG